MWQVIAKTTVISLVPKLVNRIMEAIDDFLTEDGEEIRVSSSRKTQDTTKFTQLDYIEVCFQYKKLTDWNNIDRNNTEPRGERINLDKFCIKLNELLGLNKTISAYRNLWNMTEEGTENLPSGGTSLEELVDKRRAIHEKS